MEALRSVLKRSLGQSLQALPPLDRLRAAWTVSCGPALACRGTVADYRDGEVTVEVPDPLWLDPLLQMRPVLERELAQSAGLPVRALHFRKPQP